MTEQETESEGKTVDEAVKSALKKLGLHRDQVEVRILQEAAGGILGFGAKPARVSIRRKLWGSPAKASEPRPARSPRAPRERRPAARAARSEEPREHRPPQTPVPGVPTPQEEKAAPQTTRPPSPPPDPAQACAATEEILKELLSRMLFTDASIAAKWDPEQERVKTHVRTADSERLIGPGGKTLEAVQFLMTLMVSRRLGTPAAVHVDTNDYWQMKENEILSQALKGIENVRNTGRPYRLQPMDAPMRRLIHKSLAKHPDIMTTSEGDGLWRKIVLRPRS